MPVDQAVQSNIPTHYILVRDNWYIPWATGKRQNGNGRETVKRGREKKLIISTGLQDVQEEWRGQCSGQFSAVCLVAYFVKLLSGRDSD